MAGDTVSRLLRNDNEAGLPTGHSRTAKKADFDIPTVKGRKGIGISAMFFCFGYPIVASRHLAACSIFGPRRIALSCQYARPPFVSAGKGPDARTRR